MFDLENFKCKDLFYECFDTHNVDFEKLIEIYNSEQEEVEKHHIIPKSYFKLKGIKLINKGNLIGLSIKNHFKAHYYMWKICKIPKLKHKLALAYILIKDVNPEMLDIKAEEYEGIRKQALLSLEKKVVCLSICEIYDSITKTGDRRGVSNIINGNQTTSRGLFWEEYNPEINYTKEYCLNRIEEIKKYMTRNYSCVKCVETGEIFSSIREAARVMKLDSSTIVKILKGKRKSIQGYHFIKEEKIC